MTSTIRPPNAEFADLIKADGYNLHLHEGQIRMQRMRRAWAYMLQQVATGAHPTLTDVKALGRLIEPVKNHQFRKAHRPNATLPQDLESALEGLLVLYRTTQEMIDRQARLFMAIDPFIEGTQRVAFILQEWWRLEAHC